MQDIEKIKNQLRSLKQNKEKTEEEISFLAQQKLDEQNILDELAFCINDAEKKYAKNLLDQYLSQSSFENLADRDTIKQLVDMEILVERIKSYLKRAYDTANPALPTNLIQQLQFCNEQILKLKESLGLTSSDKNQQSWIADWDNLKKKCLAYHKIHGGETYTRCPKCQHMYRILMKVDDKEKVSATFFQGTKLYNKKLFALYHEKRLTQEEVAEILGVSVHYIAFIYEELFLKELK